MKKLSHLQIRTKFSTFWQGKNHREVPPIPLVPENDPTTLFTGSGMQQLVPYLLGEKHPLGTRLYNIQRSFRAQDIDDIGDNRHTTFFEMMGNWSLGDYFKAEQIPWILTFFVEELGFDPEKIFVTVYEGQPGVPRDRESVKIWQQAFEKYQLNAAENERLFFYGKENWWSRGNAVGEPGGPDSEMFYFLGDIHKPEFGKKCHPNCDCGSYVEFCNNVFMQYEMTAKGWQPLKNKNVDMGAGIERIAAIVQGKNNIFETDLFYPVIRITEKLSGKKYGEDTKSDYSFRVLVDHLRAAVFLIGDGVVPANTEQGYVLRRLIRRAIRYARYLDLKPGFSQDLATAVVGIFGEAYPYLSKNRQLIFTHLETEEKKFQRTLEGGLREFTKLSQKKKDLSGKETFFLYETFGFPVELTQEMAAEQGLKVDFAGFVAEKKKHQEISRQGMEKKFKGGLADATEETVKLHTATHLLHQALRQILGKTVQQKGSNITAERLRFDFSHPQKLTEKEIAAVESLVNEKIAADLPVSFAIMTYEQAVKAGALAFFGERYPEKVKVYTIGNFSKEICGGPHVTRTALLGRIKITKEESAGSGLRRLYAILVKS